MSVASKLDESLIALKRLEVDSELLGKSCTRTVSVAGSKTIDAI